MKDFIVFVLTFLTFFILWTSPTKASQVILTIPQTTDCSGKGGSSGNFSSPCMNTVQTNGTRPIWTSSDPFIGFPTVIGHHYQISYDSTAFSRWFQSYDQEDYMGILAIPEQDSLTSSVGGWLCGRLDCSWLNNGLTFQASYIYSSFATASGCDHSTGCYLSNVVITDLDAESPTPTPSPVSKVFFVPGMGASWNADAFANCKVDIDSSHWSLAPYAESVYNPIFQAIKDSKWNLYPFFYDWRAQVASNSDELKQFVQENSQNNERVNLVGHSMGGLVGREYLKSNSGEKLNSLLTIGTPHKGSALAYPSWAGGDIWNDNFLVKTALTLYIKHCGGLFANDLLTIQNQVPSVQNLLPTESYLRKVKSTDIYLPNHPINTNNLLSSPYANPWGVRIGTISGTGFSTLNVIQTKDASQKELNAGNWLDGKPNGKIYSMDGDGTVLSSSAILSEADYKAALNQTHMGLVNSVEGMAEILKFLGSSPTSLNTQTAIEPNSALILIGYPANFQVTDDQGKTKYDKDGMVSFINPKSGTFKINLLPKSGKTLFVVAQFLPNGQTLYNEYSFSNLLPKFKTVKFDLGKPSEDILN